MNTEAWSEVNGSHMCEVIRTDVAPHIVAWSKHEGIGLDDIVETTIEPAPDRQPNSWILCIHLADGRIRAFPFQLPRAN